MRIEATNVNEYLATAPDDRRPALALLRALILETIPDASESIRYGMPTYDAGDDFLVAVASQKNYMSLYLNTDILETHRGDFGKLDCGKGCVRFRRIDQVPLETVRTIITETAARNRQR